MHKLFLMCVSIVVVTLVGGCGLDETAQGLGQVVGTGLGCAIGQSSADGFVPILFEQRADGAYVPDGGGTLQVQTHAGTDGYLLAFDLGLHSGEIPETTKSVDGGCAPGNRMVVLLSSEAGESVAEANAALTLNDGGEMPGDFLDLEIKQVTASFPDGGTLTLPDVHFQGTVQSL
jgi:hypothetical protein